MVKSVFHKEIAASINYTSNSSLFEYSQQFHICSQHCVQLGRLELFRTFYLPPPSVGSIGPETMCS